MTTKPPAVARVSLIVT